MGDGVVLLDFWPSPFGMRVRIALKEKGIDYESKEENLNNKSPLLLKMNPVHKQIPVLIHNGNPICESLIIVQYIDEVWKDKAPLLPSDPYERAHARFWADYVDKKIYSTGRLVWATKGEVQETAKKELIECFKLLETDWFYAFETLGNFSMIHECPKLVGWAKRCIQKKSVSSSLPDQYKVYDFILELKKKLELD
ncbi:Glutathione S-transferase 5 [Datura stramonium]|uniref:Glutathione S-transferase n=1 Tax=Datura stramonium TaxID=4076 RepID=A0ABS8WI52_DATST|nr:Glutathione S-transferase 5 [Datura stramonium]